MSPLRRKLFAVSILLIILSGPNAKAKYSGGSGTDVDPYQIANAADPLALAATSAHAGLKWSYDPNGGPIYYSSPAIGPGGTIYVGSGAPFAGAPTRGLYAVNPDGTLKWQYTSAGMPNMYTPSVGSDGTIYVQDALSSLYAVNQDGTLKWKYPLNTQINVGQTAPAIGSDGTVYIGADTLYAINPDGTLKWQNTHNGMGAGNVIRSSPAIASDGTIYVGANGYFGDPGIAFGNALLALNPDGTFKWEYILQGTSWVFSSPSIGADGTIYIGAEAYGDTNYVYAINPDGTLKWRYDVSGGRTVRSSPAIGVDGTIYIGTKEGGTINAEFLALNPDGTLKWKYSFDVATEVYCSPAIGADGIIYFGAETGFLYALNPDGTLAWKYYTYNGINWTSPAIDTNGTVYIGNNDGKLFAINSSSMGLAGSPWPKFRHDNTNTGNWSSKQPVTITTAGPLPTGTVGSDYNVALQVSGGTGPYTWSVVSNSLPSGLILSSGGVISGTPSAAETAGFTVQVTDNDGLSSTKAFSLTINPAPTALMINTVGNGLVTTNPDQATYSYGDTVELTAIPDVGWSFDSWSGDLSGSTNPDTITIDGNDTVTATFTMNGAGDSNDCWMSITKCVVIAGKTEGYDKILISGEMNATADDFNNANVIEVTIDSKDIDPCVLTFPIDAKTFKKGKYRYAKTESGSRKSFTYNTKTGKFTFKAKHIDLSGLGCPVTLQIKIGDSIGTTQVGEDIVNGAKKPIPINLMMGVKNSLRIDKIKVKHSTKLNSDYLSVKGGFAVKEVDVDMAAADFVVGLAGQKFTIPAGKFKAGKGNFTCSKVKLNEGGIATANFNFNTCIFTLTVKDTEIMAEPGAADFKIEFGDFNEGVTVNLGP